MDAHQPRSAANHTGIFASAQFALTFPPLKSVVSPKTLSSLRAKAEKLGRSRGLSALTKAQYKFQADWLAADDVAYMEYIMFPTGGRTPVSPTPNSVYITMWVGLMVGYSYIMQSFIGTVLRLDIRIESIPDRKSVV